MTAVSLVEAPFADCPCFQFPIIVGHYGSAALQKCCIVLCSPHHVVLFITAFGDFLTTLHQLLFFNLQLLLCLSQLSALQHGIKLRPQLCIGLQDMWLDEQSTAIPALF